MSAAPAGGWQKWVRHLFSELVDDDVLGHGAKLAFYAFLALPPALMATFGAAGLYGSESLAQWLREQAALALPRSVNESIVQPFISEVLLSRAPGPFSLGLLLALWGGSSVFAGLMGSLNEAFDVEEGRSWFRRRAIALATLVAAIGLFLVAATALLAGPAIAKAIRLGGVAERAWMVAQWPLAFVFIVIAFWAAYYILPNRDQAACKVTLLKASAIAAALWVAATAGFRLYIANFSSYSQTYGILGAFIVLLLWLYVTSVVVLVGGEIASELERGRRERA